MSDPGRWLFDLRVDRDMRLTKASELLGVSKSFLSRLESGSKMVSEQLIPKIAHLYEQSEEWVKEKVLIDKSIRNITSTIQEMDLTKKTQVIALARALDQEGVLEELSKINKIDEGNSKDEEA